MQCSGFSQAPLSGALHVKNTRARPDNDGAVFMSHVTLDAINKGSTEHFIEVLGEVFESSPWLVERAASSRPFSSRDDLIARLIDVMRTASPDEKLALIRAHPDLAGTAARAGNLTAHSAREQSSVGLDRLTDDEHATLRDLNAAYRSRFGFPFIIAVRDQTKQSILEAFRNRLNNGHDVEVAEATRNIARIVSLRIIDRVAE